MTGKKYFICCFLFVFFMTVVVSCSPKKEPKDIPDNKGDSESQKADKEKNQEPSVDGDRNTDDAQKPVQENVEHKASEQTSPDWNQDDSAQPQAEHESAQPANEVPEREEDRQKELAVDPKTCKITHCQTFPGFEQNGLKCETDKILKAEYKSGDETYKILHIKKFIEAGDTSGNCNGEEVTAIECYLNEKDYAKAYRKAGWSYYDERTFYIYDESLCDEQRGVNKDLAIDPNDCMVTHCKTYPGYEEKGLECQTEAILKAGLSADLQSPHLEIMKYSGASCHDSGTAPEKVYQCFLTIPEMLKACRKLGRDKCNDKDESIKHRGWARIIDKSACEDDEAEDVHTALTNCLVINPKTCEVEIADDHCDWGLNSIYQVGDVVDDPERCVPSRK